MAFRSLLILVLVFAARPSDARQTEDPYAWDDATIYRIVTDRFSNGDSVNDGAYGRGLDGNGTPYETDSLGHFLGGDFKGITGWIRDGYFSELGVNVLRISAPYQQVHGWTGRGSAQRYGFDGTMPLDYTEPDGAFGSRDDFAELVRTAHEAGLRLIIEVQLAGPGAPTLHDMVELGFGGIRSENWRSWRPTGGGSWNEAFDLFVDESATDSVWARWWGPAWVRADLPGYESCGDPCPTSGVKFRTEPDSLPLPRFLVQKWGDEKTAAVRTGLDAFFERTGYSRSASFAVVKWVSDWIREFGVDGVVVTDAAHVDEQVLRAMNQEGATALAAYRAREGVVASAQQSGVPEKPFWLVADGSGVDAAAAAGSVDAAYAEPLTAGSVSELNEAWSAAAAALADRIDYRAVTTLPSTGRAAPGALASSATGGDDDDTLSRAVRLLLTPGPVSLPYGAETGRHVGTQSMMNWITMDEEKRTVWSTLGSFRDAHPAVARGGHEVLTEKPLSFFRGVRIGQQVDRVVIVMGAGEERTRLNVARIWPDDTALRDAMTGNIALVTFGQVTMTPGPSGILLIEEIPE